MATGSQAFAVPLLTNWSQFRWIFILNRLFWFVSLQILIYFEFPAGLTNPKLTTSVNVIIDDCDTELKKQHTHTYGYKKKVIDRVVHEPSNFHNWQTVTAILNWNMSGETLWQNKQKVINHFPITKTPIRNSCSSAHQSVISDINQRSSYNLALIWPLSHCSEKPKDTITNTGTFRRKATVKEGIRNKN